MDEPATLCVGYPLRVYSMLWVSVRQRSTEDGGLDDLCLPESKSCCRKHKKLDKQGVKSQKKKKMMRREITVQLDLKLLHILISTRRLQFLQLNA